jgi:hypothetical protein
MSEVFQPTHVAPADGLQVWPAPDPSQRAEAALDPGLPVAIAEYEGAWARIVCANGYSAWTDAGRLLPVPSAHTAATPATRKWWWPTAAVVGVLLVAGAAWMLATDDKATTRGSEGSDAGTATTPDLSLVALNLPDGWFMSDDGLTVAKIQADLTADVPSGPRVRTEVGDTDTSGDELALITEGASASALEFDDPSEISVSGVVAFTVTARDTEMTRTFIATHPPGRDAVFFILEAPTVRFAEVSELLAKVPGLDLG